MAIDVDKPVKLAVGSSGSSTQAALVPVSPWNRLSHPISEAMISRSQRRQELFGSGRIPVPKTPAADFADAKAALLDGIKPFNVDEVDAKDKLLAVSYNLVSRVRSAHIQARIDYNALKAYDRFTAQQYRQCEGICMILRLSCLDQGQVCPGGKNLILWDSRKILPDITIWRAILYWKVGVSRTLMGPLLKIPGFRTSDGLARVIHDLGRERYDSVLQELFGNSIPWALTEARVLAFLQREEMIRAYLHNGGRGRNGERYDRNDTRQMYVMREVEWMQSSTDAVVCRHQPVPWDEIFLGTGFRCGICGLYADHAQECWRCSEITCAPCRKKIWEMNRDKDRSWTWLESGTCRLRG